MAFAAGTRFGVYEIGGLIGVGGMGEVYRARDTTLGRDVALKALPDSFAADADRIARFEREAKTLASLNHTNIGQIFGLERRDGTTALVMELVEGPTLADRLMQGPIPVDEALNIAMQIADALEAAHALGIVHRDLKPANIKLRPDGTVKVLDFGIAKALNARAISGPQAPASTAPAMTEAGVLLGTAAYMSPEQARGKPIDERADIWAFGCLLYEMLAGRPAFADEDATTTLARVLERETDMRALPQTMSPAVRHAIKLCLEKDKRKRISHIRDVKLALEGAFETAESLTAVSPSARPAWIAAFAVAALSAVVLAIPALQHLRETPLPTIETRLDIVTPSTNYPESFALSPDGRQIVFVASGAKSSQLWLRSLTTGTAQPLSGTEGAWLPFWSPNSRSIGFFADASLKRLDLAGGVPQTLAAAYNGAGGTWNADDVIVFAPGTTSRLMRVSASGGAVTPVLPLQSRQYSHSDPYFLPDGFRFLFRAQGDPDGTGIYIGALDGSVSRLLTPSGGDARYLATGWLLWVRAGALVAQRLDLAHSALTGELLTLAPGVSTDVWRHSAVSVSSKGEVAYRAPGGSHRQLIWFDRSGKLQGTLAEADGANPSYPRVTPDGLRVVVSREVQSNYDLWLLDGGRMSRITFDPAPDAFPALSPDGTVIVFRSGRTGSGDLYKKHLGRADPEELLLHSDRLKTPLSWSADGRFLLYANNDPETGADIWVLPMQGDGKPYAFLQTQFRETAAVFSPDGRWVAYQSNESGSSEIYLRRFFVPGETGINGPAEQWQVSTSGGTYPAWRVDGQEVYYLNPEGAMMAAPINVTGAAPVRGAPQALFNTRIYRGGQDVQQGTQYGVTDDGRFLINTELDNDVGIPITLIQNWNPEAKK
jgi:serine/threonine protein kinase